MSSTLIDPCRLDRTGSFFKQLINTFASEIGELKQEMVQTGLAADRDPETPDMQSSLEEDVSSLYLQEKDTKSSARDSGYDSLKRKLSILDRLILAHPVWLLLTLSDDEAHRILQQQQPGIFLVRKSAKLQKKVISLRLGTEFGPSIRDFPIKESQYTFSLEGSGISFADLFRLIAFYCISRDVLPFTLRLPETIAAAKTQADLEEVAQLGVEFWNSPLYNKQQSPPVRPARPLPSDSVCRLQRQQQVFPTKGLHSLRTRTPSELECSQTKGALCFVNPLFLEVHRQGAGNSSGSSLKRPKNRDPISPERSRSPPPRPPPPRKAPPLGVHGKQVSMPETVSWIKQQQIEVDNMGAGPTKKAAPIPPPRFKKYMSFSEVEGSRKSQMGDSSISSQKLQAVVARNLGSAPGVEPVVVNANVNCPPPCLQEMEVQQNRGGRQRLSDMSISTSSSDSLDYERSYAVPGGQGGDSSLEEDYEVDSDHESMAPPIKPKKKRSGSFVLPRIVKTQFRKVSGVFNSFMTPEKRMVKRIAEVSQDKRTYFGCLVQDYISFLQENKGCHVSGADMLQTIRQFMTQVKNYLAQSSELDPPIESLIPEEEIDVVLEKAMHKCILKPLKSHIEASLKDFQIASGSWKQLKENLLLAKQKKPQELGVDATAPDSVTIEKIRHKFVTMQKMYSPEKKVTLFLRVCKLIYTVMENNSGRMYGADDFLPMLTYVLAQCDMPELDTEIEYMMELLDPSLLHGEGGYYLTSAYGAMSLIKNFQEEQAARLLSSETRNTLHQWHRRRTTNRTIPTVDDFQNYLRVAFQEVNSGCTAKTLVVKPYATTEELCEVCADKFKVQDPSTYALFLVTEETSQQLAPDTYPQKIKAEIHSRPQPLPFHFVYKRPTNLQICIPPDEENGNTFL